MSDNSGIRAIDKKAAKLRKARLAGFTMLVNKTRMDISMHKLATFGDVFKAMGVGPGDLDPSILARAADPIHVGDYNNLVAFPLEVTLRNKLLGEATGIKPLAMGEVRFNDIETSGTGVSLHKEDGPPTHSHTILDSSLVTDAELSNTKTLDPDIHPIDKAGWWLPDGPNKTCTLFRHQTKAAKDMAYKLFIKGNRADALMAGVGVGKTFMYFELINQLWMHDWFKGKSFSPWPVLIVTKASIVEQTRRVGINLFGLDPFRQFKVINYDGLRASAGSSMIEDITIHQDGIAYRKWKWHPGVHPLVFILDECQSAKNEDSQQSEIVQSIAKIEDPNIKVICSSATHFTRICEAKYFVINAGIQYSVI